MADLQTKRLRMVSWNQEFVLAAIQEKGTLGRLLNVEVPNDFPSEPVREFVLPMTLKELEQDPSVGKWSGMIVHVSDAILIGSMGFKSPPDQLGNVEIGYDIIPEYQGHGYATEMAQALIEWAFHQPNVNRVTAECLVTNRPSVRVLEKVGMKKLSKTDDMLFWEMNKR
ncbi:GNAT family N-acetyltransferase [Alicyclobacillus fastidiosus]|uniref:GNAT family N-acetyltransferase n=1 Tax=Alicyclobacillus fastidiosus TaxID=392011 RepID=UPI0023E91477|nr:GNAT family N-acetyltransferase [Alicyclobacillus fastidiosus]GMA66031.1 N-acetyltransferase [Alicyclobacillus fastidiosus]